jgi:AraC-like DNA-binding protein
MRYAEHQPPDALAHVLHCLWSFEDGAGAGEPQRIVPDGRCELVVHFGEPYREVGHAEPQPRVVFAGQLTRPLWLQATGKCGVIGARFRPAAARAFVGGSMRRTTDRRLSLDEIEPGLAWGLAPSLARLPDVELRVAAVAGWVGDRIAQLALRNDLAASAAAERIEASAGDIDIAGLGADSGLGRRQFERRFGDQVGVSPALLATILRFRRVFDVIEHGGPRPWTDAAAEAGYFDQSHLVRDFRRFVGCTPTEFAASHPGLATALIEKTGV